MDLERKVLGWFIQPPGPYGLKIKTPYFKKRPIPTHILERVPKGRLLNCIQILIDGVGGDRWINIEKSWCFITSRRN